MAVRRSTSPLPRFSTCPPIRTYATEIAVHQAIDRLDDIKPGLREKLAGSESNGAIRQQRALKAEVSGALKADLLVGRSSDFDPRTRALMRSNAGNPHVLASPHGRATVFDISNTDFRCTIQRRLRQPLTEPYNGPIGVSGLCDGCNKLNCADKYGDSRLSCNATMHVTKLWHNPVVFKLAELARMSGLDVSNGVHAPPANPLSGFKTDLTIRGLLVSVVQVGTYGGGSIEGQEQETKKEDGTTSKNWRNT